jgi:hypothetical protein
MPGSRPIQIYPGFKHILLRFRIARFLLCATRPLRTRQRISVGWHQADIANDFLCHSRTLAAARPSLHSREQCRYCSCTANLKDAIPPRFRLWDTAPTLAVAKDGSAAMIRSGPSASLLRVPGAIRCRGCGRYWPDRSARRCCPRTAGAAGGWLAARLPLS